MVVMILNRNPTNIEYCEQDGHTWKYWCEMETNERKAKMLQEIDDRDDDP